MTRALAGGFSARALSWSRVPAATVWPAPLTFAAVAPQASIAARTSAGSPPTTALMPVGVAAAAAAMLLARSRTKVMASVSVSTPARADAVISPTEWPARMTGRVPSSTSNRDFAATSPAATISGCATAVSLMVSSSEVVPWAVRSMPAISLREARWPATGGSSSQGARKPGVWEPCPGQTIASTYPAFQTKARLSVHSCTKLTGSLCRKSTTSQRLFRDGCRSVAGFGGAASRPTTRAVWSTKASRGNSGSQPVTSQTRLSR